MPNTQPNPVGNTLIPAIVQKNMEELFELAHEHIIWRSFPAASAGTPGSMALVDDGTDVYFVVKTSRGWFRTDALTAI